MDAPDRELTGAALGMGWPMLGLLDRRVRVHDEADVDPEAATAGAVLLLPGAVNVPHASTALGLELASRGHHVLMLDLGFGIEALDVPLDGSMASALAVYEALETEALDAHVDRARRALDWLGAPTLGLPPERRVLVVGHSHGGGVALELCRTTDRCAGVVNLDGPAYASVRASGTSAPWVHVASRDPEPMSDATLDRLGWAASYREIKELELSWVDEARASSFRACSAHMAEAGHMDFTDFPFLMPGYRSDLAPELAHARTVHAVTSARDHANMEPSSCAALYATLGDGFTAR